MKPALSYKGNPKLKKLNQSMEWNAEQMAEYLKCEADPVYFAGKYVKIIHVDHGLISFHPYEYQKDIITSFIENRYTTVLAARQCGKSTAVVGAILHYILFNEAKCVGILANRAATARQILGRVKLAYENLPKWLQHGVALFNAGTFVLENGSSVLADATKSDSVRGWSLSALVIDEAAFVQNWSTFFASVFPTITSGAHTKVMLVSTPCGLNHYADIWKRANMKDSQWNGFKPIRVSWEDVPGRDEAWAQGMIKIMGKEKFAQEMSIKFLGSTKTLIDGDILESMVWQPILKEAGGLRVYREPVRGSTYVLTADVSHGKGLDYSAFNVVDVTVLPYKQVAVFRDNGVDPNEYAEIIFNVSNAYNHCEVLIEANDIGSQLINVLRMDFEFERLITTVNKGKLGKTASNGGARSEYGLRQTKSSKAVGCSSLKEMIEKGHLLIMDQYTIEELSTFSKVQRITSYSYEAEEGKFDDVVMSLVNFGWLVEQQYFREMTDTDLRAKLRSDNEQKMQDQLMTVGFYDDGNQPNAYEEEDLRELLGTYDKQVSAPAYPDDMYPDMNRSWQAQKPRPREGNVEDLSREELIGLLKGKRA